MNWQQQQLLQQQLVSDADKAQNRGKKQLDSNNHSKSVVVNDTKEMRKTEKVQEKLLQQWQDQNKGKDGNFAGSAFMNAPAASEMPLPDF